MPGASKPSAKKKLLNFGSKKATSKNLQLALSESCESVTGDLEEGLISTVGNFKGHLITKMLT